MLTFPSAPNHVRPPPQTTDLASASPEGQPSRSDAGTQLTAFSQISAHASGTWRHSHLLVSFSIRDFYFDISEWHILPACTWTPALTLHLTNTCAKRKVLSLTKPKGKIYKTESLSHYITIGVFWVSHLGKREGIQYDKYNWTIYAHLPVFYCIYQ